MKPKHSLCWIRRDLRLADHRALYEACCISQSVVVVFVYDTTILNKLKNKNDRRVTFIHNSVNLVDQKLREKGSALVTLYGDPREEIPLLAKKLSVEAVFCNRDYEPSAKERDKIVADRLQSKGIAFHSYKDQVVFEGLDIATKTGNPFRVFTPYKRAWLKKLGVEDIRIFRPNLKKLTPIKYFKGTLVRRTLNDIGFQNNQIWLEAGEDAAQKRLTKFLKNIDNYEKIRDLPAEGGTSGLSVHLRFGTISIRRLVREACKFKSKGSKTWLSELIWRDFYQMILDRFPNIVEHTFLPQYDQIKWPGSNAHFKAWKEGRTGYPLVDAAMRHFNATGWMHNRLRMVVASFLTKDLLVYWRRGEQYFAENLLDYDLAANNGGWQWCASTGCDAQPYFRIFNPVNQSKNFDPKGIFIRKHIPELANFTDKRIHWPHGATIEEQEKALCLLGKDYSKPIVDHSLQRAKALQLFKSIKNRMAI